MILVGFAMLAGVVTIASPCILPLLPIVLSGSTGGGTARPYGIVAGFVLLFSTATLAFSVIVQATGISPNALRWIAVVVLSLFGLVMLLPSLLARFEAWASKVAGAGSSIQRRAGSGFTGGLVVGGTLGLVWTPCVGPIMASVITLAATGAVTGLSVAVTVAYAIGTAIPMLAIILGGRALFSRLGSVKRASLALQRTFAVLMIVVAAAIALNLDRQFQALVLDAFPGLEQSIISVEQNDRVRAELQRLQQP